MNKNFICFNLNYIIFIDYNKKSQKMLSYNLDNMNGFNRFKIFEFKYLINKYSNTHSCNVSDILAYLSFNIQADCDNY